MADNFINSVQVNIPGTNFFDLSHDVKFSMRMGSLFPCMVLECLPNDRMRISQEALTKFAPLVSPVMHRMNVTIHNWFVPFRLLWDHWEEWISQKAVYAFPTVTLTSLNTVEGSLADYLGFPKLEASTERVVSAFPFAAYQFIYNERYRDQNLIAEVDYKLVDGDNTSNADLFLLRRSAWMHDYFTSCAPDTQVGDPVEISPTQVFKDVKVKYNPRIAMSGDFIPTGDANTGPFDDGAVVTQEGQSDTGDAVFDAVPGALWAETSELDTNAITVNDFRLAEMLQRYRERLMRVGRRFNEWLRGVWGVTPEDARLQQPEYIGGTISPVIVSDIMSTADTLDAGATTGRPAGDRAGTAMAVNSGREGYYHCKESGCIVTLIRVLPVTAYQQGIPKFYLKTDPLDFYTPDLAMIGEQPVQNQELYANHPDPTGDFGYLPAYPDYRIAHSRVAGQFKTTLLHWHLGRVFSTPPALNAAFVECDPATRIFAVEGGPNSDQLYVTVVHRIGAIRPVTKFGIPGL